MYKQPSEVSPVLLMVQLSETATLSRKQATKTRLAYMGAGMDELAGETLREAVVVRGAAGGRYRTRRARGTEKERNR